MNRKLDIDAELRKILFQIQKENISETEWAKIESSDMFQSDSYCGGFDATEMEFCFSYYLNKEEYWFQFSLTQVSKLLTNEASKLSIRPAQI